ncbi:hypothetical protein B0A69_16575 [Chryseobacterium shigense]|uniref:Helix-turn-helix domain-containing protein n=1 Tax=Chryseobacterium shigense TaxID=297244 RepID=A0A1N7HX72_9FLAO|nr:helix-turn-helix domain-containing protein [Chryseobacterium shigense]PQA92033.1 hypothetical protein B0A69_16575 [Chryseobacterium shigense]SIS29371.1 Helix-turn-helix domain-containing protein [Chryseobacterium shigense]
MIIECIVFSGIAAALLCTLLLLSKNENRHSEYYLMIWMTVCCSGLIYYLFPSVLPEYLQSFGFTIPVLSMAMLYLYVISITFNTELRSKYLIRHSLFYIFYNVVFILTSALYQKIGFKNNIPYFINGKQMEVMNFLTYPMAALPVLYIILCFSALKKYQRLLPEYYSALEKISLNWLKYIFVSLIVLFLVVFCIITFSSRAENLSLSGTFRIVAAVQSIYLFCIVFFSLRQRLIFSPHGVWVAPDQNDKEKASPVNAGNVSHDISMKLLELMITDQPYLDEDLSLLKLSQQLEVSTHQLSQVINQNLNTNFYQLVNSYRVEEVKKKLKDPQFSKFSILGIAFESGFNSKSTFNKIFKEETGMTPSEYKKSGLPTKES